MTTGKIPRRIIQTDKSRDLPLLARAATMNLRLLNPDFEYLFFDDSEVEEFIDTEFPQYRPVINSFSVRIRSRAALANRQASSNRGGNCCRHPEPHAGAGSTELRPHRMTLSRPVITASTRLIHATRSHSDLSFRCRTMFPFAPSDAERK
jgi:hypothetical protein